MNRGMNTAQEPSSGPPPAGWVIDAPVTRPWFFAGEATPWTEGLLDGLRALALRAPALGVVEGTNVPRSAPRRPRIDARRRAEASSELIAAASALGHPDLSAASDIRN